MCISLLQELISKDEGKHCDFGCLLYRKLQHQLEQSRAHAIVGEAVESELAFVDDALPVAVIGLNADDMKEYVRFVADRLLIALGYEKLYNAQCTLDFMEQLSLSGKSNFFERRVGEYGKAILVPNQTKEFKLDDDF